MFIGTPKGKNAFHALWTHAETDPDWLALQLKASETGLLEAAELADAARMMSEDEYAQEYECSFEAAVRGAYYGKEMNAAGEDERLASVPYDPRLPVHTVAKANRSRALTCGSGSACCAGADCRHRRSGCCLRSPCCMRRSPRW